MPLRWWRRGFTLIEMIVVITIFAMMLGFTVALLRNARKDLGVQAAWHHAVALLRGAHQRARSAGSPAWVVMDTRQNTIQMLYKETVGEWHFEDTEGGKSPGAFGQQARVSEGTLVRGRVGQGILLKSSGVIDCGEIPVYASDQGISVEFWFQRRAGRLGRQSLFTIGGEVSGAMDSDGRAEGKVGTLSVGSGDFRVPSETWCSYQLVYALGRLRLLLDGVLVGEATGSSTWSRNSPLLLGDSKAGFSGIIDEFRVGLIIPRDVYALPAECRFVVPSSQVDRNGHFVVHFDASGRLDPSVHRSEPRFTLESPDAKREVVVGLGGNVQR